ncbi:hypothetical protein DCAR_0935685 [Daucus carota subsp. sativus]|uniref:Pentatricopeptide repeat-containing protein n=1 Tax=Daucus carota subsp. sativus TaxID=79200 RepID=A0AAF0XXJ6_DAUCS|nr:PREDICTED: pentatricopeptide repeat-containing protein At4g02750-like [Daucus carota subsp. sativus]WOH16136.1 hypothetical protein DCAR_0935685 [Daucus carota subsp. sativus]
MNHKVLNLLNRCHTLKDLKSLHSRLVIEGSVNSSDILLNKVLRFYFRYGEINYAHKLFDQVPEPNAFLWTSMIHGYVENKKYGESFGMFRCMLGLSIPPLNFTVMSVLKALARSGGLKEGEAVYGFVRKCGFGFDVMVQNAVIDLFMRCGEVDLARLVFDEMSEKDVVTWNSMISGYGNNGRVDVARELFECMGERNLISWTSIISGYVKGGDMIEAQILFEAMPTKDLAVWNVMISGYVDIGDLDAAVNLLEAMPMHEVTTWNIILLGFCKAHDLKSAKSYFGKMRCKNVASWTMMVDGYVKLGDLNEARLVFEEMPEKNLIAWSTMIAGYAKNGQPQRALELFVQFKEQGIKPDVTLIIGIITACSHMGILDVAESVINDYIGPSLYSNLHVITSLIDMYAKCGSIEKAWKVFETTSEKDLLCYSTMIAAFANHGLGHEAISLFHDMQREHIKPDGVTFIGVLSACNHGGLVTEGRRFFKQMIEEYDTQPTEKHYACMVDLLGRVGCLQEAHNLIASMPMAPSSVVWGALLAACSVHRNVELAEIAAAELFKIEPDNSGNYILLSNIYASAGRWRDVSNVRAMIRSQRVRKNRGSSWIELGAVVHEFVMADNSHRHADDIYSILELLTEDMQLSYV